MISGGPARTYSCYAELRTQQGIFQNFSGVMLSLLPGQASYSSPSLSHQFEGTVNQLGMFQVGGVGQVLT